MNKAYNATVAGQMGMAYDASSRAPAFQMNKIIKSKGGVGWPDDMIASAEPILLRSIKENLLEEYNSLVTALARSAGREGIGEQSRSI